DIRDIAHLKVGDIQELSKLNPVGRRLVEHKKLRHCPTYAAGGKRHWQWKESVLTIRRMCQAF
ncbi:MAG: hypothetical protein U0N22_07775, partial [Acutalibacter sp.]